LPVRAWSIPARSRTATEIAHDSDTGTSDSRSALNRLFVLTTQVALMLILAFIPSIWRRPPGADGGADGRCPRDVRVATAVPFVTQSCDANRGTEHIDAAVETVVADDPDRISGSSTAIAASSASVASAVSFRGASRSLGPHPGFDFMVKDFSTIEPEPWPL